jgi:hypothetical protein
MLCRLLFSRGIDEKKFAVMNEIGFGKIGGVGRGGVSSIAMRVGDAMHRVSTGKSGRRGRRPLRAMPSVKPGVALARRGRRPRRPDAPLGVGSSLRRIEGKAPALRSRPERPDLHNRGSSTHGTSTPPSLPARQDIDGKVLPYRQGLYIHPYRRSMTYGYEDLALRATERKAGALPFIRRRPEPTPSGRRAPQTAEFSQTPDSKLRRLRSSAGSRILNSAVCGVQPEAGFRTPQSAEFSRKPDSELRRLRSLAGSRIPSSAVCDVQPDASLRTSQTATLKTKLRFKQIKKIPTQFSTERNKTKIIR